LYVSKENGLGVRKWQLSLHRHYKSYCKVIRGTPEETSAFVEKKDKKTYKRGCYLKIKKNV